MYQNKMLTLRLTVCRLVKDRPHKEKLANNCLRKALVTTYFHFSDCLYLPHMKMATSWYDKRKHTKWDYAMHPVRKGKLYS